MMLRTLTVATLLLLALPVRAQDRAPASLLLVGAKVLAPEADRWLDAAVLITGDRIAAVGPEPALALPADPAPQRIDLRGLYLIPGLIDLHTHLLLHPYNEASWDDQVLREALEFRTIRAVAAARATLEAGFTTVRDLGTEGAGFADVALRDAIAQGLIPGPRIFAATRAIVATACYGPAGFDPRWEVPKGAQEATGADAVRRAVREQIAAGADWVKLYADYRRSAGAPATPTFSQEELDAAVDEARSAGRPVAVHATTDEGIRRAVLAGAATIEHGYGASRATLQLMKERGVVLCPTLAAAEAVARYAGWKPGDPAHPEPPGLARSRTSFRLALEVGVTIGCGGDAGVFAHGDNARELELMVENGMTPAQALRAATVVAGTVLGRPTELGRLAAGARGDAVALRGDPLTDPAGFRQPVLVIRRGSVNIDRR